MGCLELRFEGSLIWMSTNEEQRDAYLGFEIRNGHLERLCPLETARLQLENVKTDISKNIGLRRLILTGSLQIIVLITSCAASLWPFFLCEAGS